jgi:hypothetical protein
MIGTVFGFGIPLPMAKIETLYASPALDLDLIDRISRYKKHVVQHAANKAPAKKAAPAKKIAKKAARPAKRSLRYK